MKLLYVAPVPIDFKNLDGVPKKILCQANALANAFDVEIIYYFADNVCLYSLKDKKRKVIGKASSKLSVLRQAYKLLDKEEYKGIYIRYPRSDYYFVRLLKKIKRQCICNIVEIPTYPYDMEGAETIKGCFINFLDHVYRNKLSKYVDRIVTYSNDVEIFGIPTINTINGIDFGSISYDDEKIDTDKCINLIAVSAMFRVHGYERLIEGMHDYYSCGGSRMIILKLVGEGDECEKYKELVTKYGLHDNVIFYGAKFGKELQDIYRGNAVGINSLAIHRQGLSSESTLKTKEYAAKGLPVLSSSYVDSFSPEGNKRYVLQIPPDETNVDIEKMILFVDSLYSQEISEVRKLIREDGMKTCDISITMKPIIDFYKGKCKG
ncbi:glycosyltransferase family 1 protein [Ruminococcus sp. AM42-11]|uniref:glycosyltransferase n=1 Tax=Ruminococcus sp. AM42-11 TaxID=2292372 RepID=UPI000E4C84B2|nr:glycosyltransferase [Ruminococcus sp. AM42-11]RHT01142.1 glycosyltransferase family 1 protein [Ruminococcus sp. AM42-11]